METENKNYLENIAQSIKKSVTLKLLSIFILMMLLMIPINIIQDLIQEREETRQKIVKDVSHNWADEQLVYGPILSIPLQKKVQEDGKTVTLNETLHLLPEELKVKGNVSPKKLRRGIYEVAVYDSHLAFSGKFGNIQEVLDPLDEYIILLEDAFLTIHISDLRGIKENVILKWAGQQKDIHPGSNIPNLIPSGFTVKNILKTNSLENQIFNFDVKLQGSQFLGFVPLGKETNVDLSSDWKDPSFSGAFLPDDRTVNEQGFAANWRVLELNRNYPQSWIGDRNIEVLNNSSFGVDLILPVNDYQKSMRSAKYALLAISLTFLSFFLIEIFNKKKVHPFQYILIGLALCIFYTLLVSISEHLDFNKAYLISSVISMIGLYARTIISNVKQLAVLVLILSFTYLFVFITLQLQDYALLIGSIGLTSILAITMYITRNINWHDMNSKED